MNYYKRIKFLVVRPDSFIQIVEFIYRQWLRQLVWFEFLFLNMIAVLPAEFHAFI